MEQKPVILDINDEDILRFQLHRIIINFYKDLLTMIEDLSEDHDTALFKLQEHLPEEYKKYVDLADYFPEERFKKLRGRILDGGNGTIRDIEMQMKNFDITIKRG